MLAGLEQKSAYSKKTQLLSLLILASSNHVFKFKICNNRKPHLTPIYNYIYTIAKKKYYESLLKPE